tara:strand:- start:235 stop:717 length:483 start_codon:yes stop_codon:yes gene_type:complete
MDVLGIVCALGAVAVLVLVLLSLTGGCATVRDASTPVFGPLPDAYEPPARPQFEPMAGECRDAVPLAPGASRDCLSLSMDPATAREDQAVMDIAKVTEVALYEAQQGWASDRETGQRIIDARETQLAVSRANAPRVFAAGVIVGVLSAAGAGIAVAMATR